MIGHVILKQKSNNKNQLGIIPRKMRRIKNVLFLLFLQLSWQSRQSNQFHFYSLLDTFVLLSQSSFTYCKQILSKYT